MCKPNLIATGTMPLDNGETITVHIYDGLTCPKCGAKEIEDNSLPVDEWVFNIRAFRVDDWSNCNKCGCWFNKEGKIE